MKVLVSTKETQGQRKNDFCFVPEGEILRFGFECDNEGIDSRCGCRRSMSGIFCHKATTTFKVVDLPIAESDFIQKIQDSVIKSGLGKVDASGAKELLRIANIFAVGDVVEKRGVTLRKREIKK